MPGKLSELLEKIEAKYPDDEDVMALSAELDMGEESPEDGADPFGDMFGEEEEMSEEPAGDMAFDDLFAEDMEDTGDEEADLDMPAPKKKKNPKEY